jgi:hypothetical protein
MIRQTDSNCTGGRWNMTKLRYKENYMVSDKGSIASSTRTIQQHQQTFLLDGPMNNGNNNNHTGTSSQNKFSFMFVSAA